MIRSPTLPLITKIKRQESTIRFLKRCIIYMTLILLLTWLSGAAVLFTGKFPPIEIKLKKLDFGSVYLGEGVKGE